jgi:uncharacterized membrane protein
MSIKVDKKALKVALLFLALIGLLDTIFIYSKVSDNEYVRCIVGQGCDLVLYSRYSKLFGISLALIGMVFYLLLAVLIFFWIFSENKMIKNLVSLMVFGGFLFSAYLFFIQVFKLKALCNYCIISFLDLILSLVIIFFIRKKSAFLQS